MSNQNIVDAAFELCHFCKMNGYPPPMSQEFFKLTDLVHKLECAFLQNGMSVCKSTSNEPATDNNLDSPINL